MIGQLRRRDGASSDPSASRIQTPVSMASAASIIFSQSISQWATFPHKTLVLQFPKISHAHHGGINEMPNDSAQVSKYCPTKRKYHHMSGKITRHTPELFRRSCLQPGYFDLNCTF
jgi:hypothetical protein